MTKDPSRASDWIKRRGRVSQEDTTADSLPDPFRLAVFVSAIAGVGLYLAMRLLLNLDVALSAIVAIVAFMPITIVLEGYYHSRR